MRRVLGTSLGVYVIVRKWAETSCYVEIEHRKGSSLYVRNPGK